MNREFSLEEMLPGKYLYSVGPCRYHDDAYITIGTGYQLVSITGTDALLRELRRRAALAPACEERAVIARIDGDHILCRDLLLARDGWSATAEAIRKLIERRKG